MTTQTIRRPEVTFHLSLVSLGKVKKKKKNITVHDMSDIDENFIASKCSYK